MKLNFMPGDEIRCTCAPDCGFGGFMERIEVHGEEQRLVIYLTNGTSLWYDQAEVIVDPNEEPCEVPL